VLYHRPRASTSYRGNKDEEGTGGRGGEERKGLPFLVGPQVGKGETEERRGESTTGSCFLSRLPSPGWKRRRGGGGTGKRPRNLRFSMLSMRGMRKVLKVKKEKAIRDISSLCSPLSHQRLGQAEEGTQGRKRMYILFDHPGELGKIRTEEEEKEERGGDRERLPQGNSSSLLFLEGGGNLQRRRREEIKEGTDTVTFITCTTNISSSPGQQGDRLGKKT